MLDTNPQLNEKQQSGQNWSMDTWYERSHINPKVRGFDNKVDLESANNAQQFSTQIRQGIPIPPLANSQAGAEKQAQSAAQASQ